MPSTTPSSTTADGPRPAWPDTEALVAIVGLSIALSVAVVGVAAITTGRVIDDTRPPLDASSAPDDEHPWRYVFGA